MLGTKIIAEGIFLEIGTVSCPAPLGMSRNSIPIFLLLLFSPI